MPVTELTDAELTERCRARDEDAVRELTRRYNQRLYRIARAIVRDDAEAEDVVQDAYVRALTGLEGFRGDSGLGTWLTRITINEALGRMRRRRPLQMAAGFVKAGSMEAGSLDPAQAAELASTMPDPEKLMATLESRVFLEEAIDALPDDFRTIFVARIVEARMGSAVREAFAFDGSRCDRLTNAVLARLAGSEDPASIGHLSPASTSN